MAKGDQIVSPGQFTLGNSSFDDFVLVPDESLLLRRGRRIKLQPQPYRVLAYLVARSPAIVTREELGEHVWQPGVHVDLDQSLGYCIRQIRQVLGDSATQPRYVETLPRQGYRFVCPVESVTAPPAPTPEPPQPVDEGPDPRNLAAVNAGAQPVHVALPSKPSRRPWTAAAIALSAMLLAALLFAPLRQTFSRLDPTPHVESLAVLPIENLSGDPGQEYIADGLTDELITMLAKDSTLRVVSRTSVMQYKGAHRPLPQLARALGVDAVLEGSFARSGTRTHVTLQLIRADNDSHLWAETYDRDLNDETVPTQAALAIAERLNSVVPHPAPARSVAPAAHDAFLRGSYLWPTDRSAEAGAFFRQATEIQPDYAEAWAGLANYYGYGIAVGNLDPRTNRGHEEAAAERALALAPDLALSHQAMAGTYLISRWDPVNADREVLLAIHMDPTDARSYYLRGDVLAAMNRFPEAIQAEKKSMELDPYELPVALASTYVEARLYDDALAEIKLRMAAAPHDTGLLYLEKEAWRCKNDYRQAMEALATFHTVTGDLKSAAELRQAYERNGATGFIRWELKRRLLQAKSDYVSPVELASYYAQLGDKQHALALIDEGYHQHSPDVLWVKDDPAFDFLHPEPRYQALMAKVREPQPIAR